MRSPYRLILPALIAGLALALIAAGYNVWVRSSNAAAASGAAGQRPFQGPISSQDVPPEGHDCDTEDHAAMMQDPDHHAGVVEGQDGAAGEGDVSPEEGGASPAGSHDCDGDEQRGDGDMMGGGGHSSMMREHHGTDAGNGEPAGPVGGGA